MVLKDFDRNMQMAFAGAEPGPNGESPKFYEDPKHVILADRNGVEVHIFFGENLDKPEGVNIYTFDGENKYAMNVAIASWITLDQLNETELFALGFVLNHTENWGERA